MSRDEAVSEPGAGRQPGLKTEFLIDGYCDLSVLLVQLESAVVQVAATRRAIAERLLATWSEHESQTTAGTPTNRRPTSDNSSAW